MNRTCILWWTGILCAPIALVIIHFRQMWMQEQYHYLPALGIALLLLFVARWDRNLLYPKGVLAPSLVVLSLAIVLPYAYWVWSPWLATFAWIVLLAAFLMSQRERDRDQSLFSIWWLTPLFLPLPMHLDSSLAAWLQTQSTRLSSYLLDLMRVPHALFGNVIELVGGKLFIEEACSGVQSLYTVIFCAVLTSIYFQRSSWLLPVYVAFACMWAGLMNVVRITSIALGQEWYGVDLSHGWQHATLGYICLGLAVLLLMSTDRLLRVVFFPTNPDTLNSKLANPIVRLWNAAFELVETRSDVSRAGSAGSSRGGWLLWILPLPIGLMLATSAKAISSYGRSPIAKTGLGEVLFAFDPKAELSPKFQLVEYKHVVGSADQPFGEHGDVWIGQVGAMPVTVAMNQPYPVWHDLCVCYEANGWTLNDRELVTLKDDSGKPWDCVTARFMAQDGRYAYLWFSAFNSAGEIVDPPSSSLIGRIGFSLAERKKNSTTGEIGLVQLFLETSSILTPSVTNELAAVHQESRATILRKIQEQNKQGASQ